MATSLYSSDVLTAMHTQFLSQIIRNPGDLSHQLIYSDWLEEKGLPGSDLWRTPYHDNSITELTDYQQSLFKLFADEWIKIELQTNTDKAEAEQSLRNLYQYNQLEEPRIEWVGSPKQLPKKIENSVMASVWDSVRDSVRASVWDSVSASVMASVMASVSASVWDSVRDSVMASVSWGNQEYWLSFYSYFYLAGRLKCVEPLLPYMQTALSCHWFIPTKTTVYISEHPKR